MRDAPHTPQGSGDSQSPGGEFLLYTTEDGKSRVECRFENETIWLSQKLMSELFEVEVPTINEHLKTLYESGEIDPDSTIRKFRIVRQEGKRKVARVIEHYNLDAILAVGYRVRSARGAQFRRWASERLKEYLVKGFTMDDRRLKEGGGSRYFEELLQRIRDIRSSEKVFWRKVLDIFATSIDYSPEAETSKEFFAKVQNQLHWAAHGHTAAEIIHQRADASAPNMGVTNFAGGKLLKRDTEIAKNYLSEEELNLLNRIVTAYLELAEIQAMNSVPMTMKDWVERLHQFLTMTGRDVLTHAGEISRDQALEKAHQEYERLRASKLAQPSEAEKQFIANAEKELKALEQKEREKPE